MRSLIFKLKNDTGMKKINLKIVGIFVLSILILGSCKKWIDTGLNDNPDAPKDVPLSALLPSVELNMAYVTIGGNDIARITALWMEQVQGIARQSQAQSNYLLRDLDVNNQWNSDYTTTLINLNKMLEKATSSPYYKGIAEVLTANSLGIITDVWGDMPYSEAFQGQANLTPAFDSQQQIYSTIMNLLNDAITNFGADDATVIDGDIIYDGDISLWMKAAYALKARYALHLSKINGQSAYTDALAAIPNAFTANSDDLQFNFFATQTASNPIWQFMDQRGDIVMHKFFIDMLLQRVDPRISAFAYPNSNGDYVGADFGQTNVDASLPGPAVADQAAPVYFITYAECLFIKTEAEFKTGVAEDQVKTDLVAAVTASMDKYGVLNPVYMQAYDSVVNNMTGDALYKEIMTQKYIALFFQAEVFNDWRRTDNAIGLVANPTTAAQRNIIPRRFPYSADEKNYNPNTPSIADIWLRVWWDPAPTGQ
jgi:hypothetical protein